jgi:peptidoglycan/LPS O-acetylase OafA/YrhL
MRSAEPVPSLARTISTADNNYNAIRFVLAASVIYYHSFGLTTQARPDYLDLPLNRVGLTLGGLAVDCFFFLSGLFVTQSLYRDPSAVNFVIRRFCRLCPGLFVCLVVTAAIACVLAAGWQAWLYLLEPAFWAYILRNARFDLVWRIPGVFDGRPFTAINGSIHTLPTEVKMYALLLVLGLLRLVRSRRFILLAGLAVTLAALLAYPVFVRHIDMPDYGQAPMALFFAGTALFAVSRHVRPRWWVAVLLLCATIIVPQSWSTALALATAVAIMLCLGQMRPGWRPRADVSYGVYIYGWPCQQFVLSLDPAMNPNLLAAVSLGLSWLFARASWHFVEHPAIQFGHGLAAGWTAWRRTRRFGAIAAWPSAVALCVVFLACATMGWASTRVAVTPVSTLDVRILAFGPEQARAGKSFNVISTGQSAIWLKVDKRPPDGTTIMFDGQALDTELAPTTVTAVVPLALVAWPGDKKIYLEHRLPGLRAQSAPVFMHVTGH